jgi:hypothetical protein
MNASVAGDLCLAGMLKSTAPSAHTLTASAYGVSLGRCCGAPEQAVEHGIRI